jgi:hypothetical protein
MKKEQKKVNKKCKRNKRSTYESSYRDYNFINNAIRYSLSTAQKLRDENQANSF